MTPQRVAALVTRWVRLYTRNLPPPIAERRIDEIEADVHDHTAHERAQGTKDRRIAVRIAARMIRGLLADLSWRRDHLPKRASRPAVRVTVATAFILLVPLAAMQLTDEVAWGLADFVLAAALLGGAGFLLELAARRSGNVAHLAAATAIGVTTIVLGESDDAPGLVLFGCLLIAGTAALAVRTARRSE